MYVQTFNFYLLEVHTCQKTIEFKELYFRMSLLKMSIEGNIFVSSFGVIDFCNSIIARVFEVPVANFGLSTGLSAVLFFGRLAFTRSTLSTITACL